MNNNNIVCVFYFMYLYSIILHFFLCTFIQFYNFAHLFTSFKNCKSFLESVHELLLLYLLMYVHASGNSSE